MALLSAAMRVMVRGGFLLVPVLGMAASTQDSKPPVPEPASLERASVAGALDLVDLSFTDDEVAMMLSELADARASIARMRDIALPAETLPALVFQPLMPGIRLRPEGVEPQPLVLPTVERPEHLSSLHFADIPVLASLVRSRAVSCVELAALSITRLKAVDPRLHCVIELTEERALARARALDRELEQGHWRGPLHGIPWGAKDLLAVEGTHTTWGAEPYRDQELAYDATVVRRLDEAGAVLVAKLTLGALAYGDVWFGGKTRSPWNPERGSSGSSAGPAAAVSAGAVPFAIGSETYGSIISPARRCGTSALRPTFGRVSRHGAMALCWSLDKLGPMCRTLDDTALVLAAIAGTDGRDPSVQDHPFTVPIDVDISGWRVGVPVGAFEGEASASVLEDLEALGVELVDIQLPEVGPSALNLMLSAEAAAAFDELTRSNRDDLLTRQDPTAWPNLFRAARLLPAVEYIRASRLRTTLMTAFDTVMQDVDVLVHPPYAQDILLLTNHTGHPTVIAPCHELADGSPDAVCFTGQLFGEARLIAVAGAWQRATEWHLRHPD